jgi:aminobenzoyl-glutamate transport protein
MLSSVASDAGYLVLVPLGAAAFRSVGRHPLAGLAAAFAGVACGFGVNFLITPIDGILTEITNEALGSGVTHHIDLVSNLYFGIGSATFVVIITTIVSSRFVERRLGPYDPAAAGVRPEDLAEDAQPVTPADEARGLRYAMWGALGVIVAVALLTAIPGAPLRNPQTGEVIGDSPFMDSLILIITIVFFVAGWCYGRGAGTIKSIVLTIAWTLFFVGCTSPSRTNRGMKTGASSAHLAITCGMTKLASALIRITPTSSLGVAPQTVLAAFRAGDSPTNVITPLMPYFGARRGSHAALRQALRDRDTHLADAAFHHRPDNRLDTVLRRVVPHRNPARTGLAYPPVS